jgi:hypothetical protein
LANLTSSQNDTGGGGGGAVQNKKFLDGLVLAHGIVQTVCWCLLADIAIFVATFRNKWWAALIHGLIMTLVIAASLAIALILVKEKGGLSGFNDLDKLTKTHFILGIIVLIWTGIQLFTGIITRLLQVFWSVHPAVILGFAYPHKILGYILVILCKITVLFGWWLFSRVAFWFLVGGSFLITLIYLLRWFLMPNI